MKEDLLVRAVGGPLHNRHILVPAGRTEVYAQGLPANWWDRPPWTPTKVLRYELRELFVTSPFNDGDGRLFFCELHFSGYDPERLSNSGWNPLLHSDPNFPEVHE